MDNSQASQVPLLTFNSLYNLLREERKDSYLKKIDEYFYEAVLKFFKDKDDELNKLKSLGDKIKLEKEKKVVLNAKKLALEILNLRLSKISNIAIKNGIFDSKILDEENILEKEKDFYDSVKKNLLPLKKVI